MGLDPQNTSDRRSHRNSILRELRDLQLVAYADCQSEATKPAERAQLMRAYVALEQQRNVLRMRPAPKPVDVAELERAKAKARARSAGETPASWRSKPKASQALAPVPVAPETPLPKQSN